MDIKLKNKLLFLFEILLRVVKAVLLPLLLKWTIDMITQAPKMSLYGAYLYTIIIIIELTLLLYFGVANRHIWPIFYKEKIKFYLFKSLHDKKKLFDNGTLLNMIFDDTYNDVEPNQIFFAMFYGRLIISIISLALIGYIAGIKYFTLSLIYIILIALNLRLHRKIKYDKVNEKYKTLVDNQMDFISGYKSISQYNVFDKFYKIKERYENENIKEHMKYYIKYTLLNQINSLIVIFFNLMIIYMLLMDIKNGLITLGTYFMIFELKENVVDPIEVFKFLINEYKKIKVSRNKLKEIDKLKEIELTENVENVLETTESPQIELKNIKFQYNDKKIIFENLNLKLSGKGLYVIKGESGRGKSTLIKLILGITEPQSGEINLNGINIKKENINYVKNNIKVLMQDSSVIYDSIRENIDFGRNYEMEQIIRTLEKIALNKFKENIDYIIDFNGENISGGQLKRILLGRTIIDNSQIVIFDEPFTNLDEFNRNLIIKLIEEIKEKKMCIVISHENILDKMADKVINL
ncbi:ATP-binding cassette domain-containing protein [Marinitoga aeolica]|uniref:ABC transporter ATP-binding protein n=1 Tax=Marinitoga aeolica TaxID=2809031 RepID=A0ABY8PP01_9BACT|nr:ABC transporter ATP-binding protein [Marinitoga aeolica]WGS64345.1 ABC transporter ATP-binding protein [Marinitoga aeolica]